MPDDHRCTSLDRCVYQVLDSKRKPIFFFNKEWSIITEGEHPWWLSGDFLVACCGDHLNFWHLPTKTGVGSIDLTKLTEVHGSYQEEEVLNVKIDHREIQLMVCGKFQNSVKFVRFPLPSEESWGFLDQAPEQLDVTNNQSFKYLLTCILNWLIRSLHTCKEVVKQILLCCFLCCCGG
jgi:hypothetical protein